jgi:hypothetical protein
VDTPHKFIVNGKEVEVYFSPSDQTTSRILEFISDVDYTLEFGLLGFTRDDLGLAVIDKDNQFGVNVRGIIEQENTTGSEFANLISAGVNVKSHMGVTHSFHHKYSIADANFPSSNPTLLTGSHNWSSNAENNSDENTLIIHDATIANIYLQEFEKRWSELSIVNSIQDLIDVEVSVFPNPSAGIININSDLKIYTVSLYSVNGKYLSTTEGKTINIASNGVYFLKILTGKGSVVKKVLVE